MYEPFIGEIQWVSFNFAPSGWAMCNGQTLAISQNPALYSLLGTTYGGNGTTTFALPDLRGRVPVGVGTAPGGSANRVLGQAGGEVNHTLTADELPRHSHGYGVTDLRGSTGNPGSPAGTAFASGERVYTAPSAANSAMGPTGVASTGGGQSHANLQPSLTLNAIIALTGAFPSRP